MATKVPRTNEIRTALTARLFLPPQLVPPPPRRVAHHVASMTCKRKLEVKHKCAFTGVESTREHRLRAPCSAATGAPRHLMTRCLKCVHNTTVWICLSCWASIATKTSELVGKREGKFHLLREPVYEALAGGVDFDKLAQGQCDGGGVLTKHKDGQWDWNGCCPMCVDFSFKELPPVLTLASSLALPAVTERTVSGTVTGLSALGVEYLQKVTPATAQTCTPHRRTTSPFHGRSQSTPTCSRTPSRPRRSTRTARGSWTRLPAFDSS